MILVESFFSTRAQAIRSASFTSVRQITDAIRAFIDGWNDRFVPFVWAKTADDILAVTNREADSVTARSDVTRRALRDHGANGYWTAPGFMDSRPCGRPRDQVDDPGESSWSAAMESQRLTQPVTSRGDEWRATRATHDPRVVDDAIQPVGQCADVLFAARIESRLARSSSTGSTARVRHLGERRC